MRIGNFGLKGESVGAGFDNGVATRDGDAVQLLFGIPGPRVAVEMAKSIMAKAGGRLLLPVDAVIADKFDAEANTQVVDVDKVPAGCSARSPGS